MLKTANDTFEILNLDADKFHKKLMARIVSIARLAGHDDPESYSTDALMLVSMHNGMQQIVKKFVDARRWDGMLEAISLGGAITFDFLNNHLGMQFSSPDFFGNTDVLAISDEKYAHYITSSYHSPVSAKSIDKKIRTFNGSFFIVPNFLKETIFSNGFVPPASQPPARAIVTVPQLPATAPETIRGEWRLADAETLGKAAEVLVRRPDMLPHFLTLVETLTKIARPD